MPKYTSNVFNIPMVVVQPANPASTAHAQGSAKCFESAAALKVLFTDFKVSDSIQNRLSIFQSLQLPRVAIVQILSNDAPRSATAEKIR